MLKIGILYNWHYNYTSRLFSLSLSLGEGTAEAAEQQATAKALKAIIKIALKHMCS